MKKIAYLITDEGIDGREPKSICSATWDETARDQLLSIDKSKAYRSVSEVIVDEDKARAQALAKLNGIDRLVLGLESWHEQVYKEKGIKVKTNIAR